MTDANDTLDSNVQDGSNTLTDGAAHYLLRAAKWAKFIAIVGFVFVGLMVILAIVMMGMGSTITRAIGGGFSGVLFGLIYLVSAAITFFPVFYLFRFSTNTISGLESGSMQDVETGMQNMFKAFQFYGIIMIIVLGIYGIGILFGLMAAIFA